MTRRRDDEPAARPRSKRSTANRRRNDGGDRRRAAATEPIADDVPSELLDPQPIAPDGSVAIGMDTEPARREAPPERRPARARARDERAAPAPDDLVAQLAAQMHRTCDRLVRDQVGVADMKLLNAALKELRQALRVFADYRGIRKVSTFGSARTPPEDPAYRQAHEFARRLADLGYMVITGAGGGIMRACQEGSGRERSFGINIRLPFEQAPNEFIHRDPKLVNFKYFFTRKLMFVKEADAIALFPGGFGTHDEGFESLTLLQTGKSKIVPVVFVDAPGGRYWTTWRDYVVEHLLEKSLISPADMRLFKVTDDLDEAIAEITTFYRRYHSSRYVGAQLVLRLTEPLSDDRLHALNEEFADIVVDGRIVQTGALPAEAGEPEIAHLPRLAFEFDRRQFGRLRMLIDAVNASPGADQRPSAGRLRANG